MLNFSSIAQEWKDEKYERMPVGSIRPMGWLRTQMQENMAGFVGNLDKLVPSLINDEIYGKDRLQRHTAPKEMGNLKSGDAEGDEQYKWWNSETQSNWWDGYIRHALALNDRAALGKIAERMNYLRSTQDPDGYLGIYDRELRYRFTSENGELWAKTTLFRGMLAWIEGTGDSAVRNALIGAVDDVMEHYPIHHSHPFYSDGAFSGGIAHGLTFTDVLDRLYQITGDRRYIDYACFLYHDFSENQTSEKDVQLASILDPGYRLQSHGVHTYEHLRPLTVATFASDDNTLKKALRIYLARLEKATTVTGGAIGDEWIAGRQADATHTGYEYCSIHELLDSYTVVMQKTGNPALAENIETIFFNAAQGSRLPHQPAIAYLKTDNSYEMTGTKNGEPEPDRIQTRYKYSPAHQDVAVCCNPNAGRIAPAFLNACWMKENNTTLVATLLAPTILSTRIGQADVVIETVTEYPFEEQFQIKINLSQPVPLVLKIRKPKSVKTVHTKEPYRSDEDFLIFDRPFSTSDSLQFEFEMEIAVTEDSAREKYFTRGPLVYAWPIEAQAEKGRSYAPGFDDWYYKPISNKRYRFFGDHKAAFTNGTIEVTLLNEETQLPERITLIPFGKTILRQVSFPVD